MLYNSPLWLTLGCLLGLALSYDIAQRRIPNWLVLAGLITGIGCNLYVASAMLTPPPNSMWLALENSLLGSIAGLAILLPLYALRAMGAGDAKLMAAVGAFLGPTQVAGAALLTFVAGGVLSLLAAIWSGSLAKVFGNLRLMYMVAVAGRAAGVSLRDVQTTGRLPYAIAIALGTGLQVWLAARGGWPFV